MSLIDFQFHFNSSGKFTYLILYGYRLDSAFQDIVTSNNRIVGIEALLRVNGGKLRPNMFFELWSAPVRAKVDQLVQLLHVYNFHHKVTNKITRLYLNTEPNTILHLGDKGVASLRCLVDALGILPHQVCIELTELSSTNETILVPAIARYRQAGFLLALDDFGDGFHDIDRLFSLRPDVVKVSRQLVARFTAGDVESLESGLAMSSQIGAVCVAEGIETMAQFEQMKRLPFLLFQGFAISKPKYMEGVNKRDQIDSSDYMSI